MRKLLAWIGGVGSLLYLALWALLLHSRWGEVTTMPLNNVGDFLAGVFGPLAILWLVLGYFQQGIELRQNSAALHLQAEELARSVQQQKQMVQVAKDQYESAKEALSFETKKFNDEQERLRKVAQPLFISSKGGGAHTGEISRHSIHLLNAGAVCTNVAVFPEDSSVPVSASAALLETGKSLRIEFTLPHTPPFETARIFVTYNDARGEAGRAEYELRLTKQDEYWAASLSQVP